MVHVTKGLFDPRQKGVAWPEPNDDPNIPYVWGLNGLGAPSDGDSPIVAPLPKPETSVDPDFVRPVSENVAGLIVGTSIVCGLYGMYSGFSDPKNVNLADKSKDALLKGLMYASVFGIYVDKNS